MRNWAPIVVISAVFVALCVSFNLQTPYRSGGLLLHQKGPDGHPAHVPDIGAPDERQHANYVRTLMDCKGFPVFRPGSPDLYETYQSHQPPLYYLLAAGWCSLTGTDPVSPEGGFSLRLMNTVIGLLTLLGLVAGVWAAGGNGSGAAAAAAMTLVPMSIALHSAASNDPLLICLCTWTLVFLIGGLRGGWTLKCGLAIGMCTGLALMTKTTAVALLPVTWLAAVLAWKSEGRPKWTAVAVAVALPLVLAAPWWARNQALYGDPLAMKAFAQAFEGSPQASAFIDAFGATGYWLNMVLWWTARSAVGVFGYMDIFMFEELNMEKSGSLYSAIFVLAAVPLVLGAVSVAKAAKASKEIRNTALVATVFGVIVALLFLRFNAQYFQGQARYLYPALAVVAWLVAAHAENCRERVKGWYWLVPALVLTLLSTYSVTAIERGFGVRVDRHKG